MLKVRQAGGEASPNNGLRNMMASLPYAFRNPCHGGFGVRQTQVEQADMIALLAPVANLPNIAQPGKRGLNCKAVAALHATGYLLQHQPPRLHCGDFWRKRG